MPYRGGSVEAPDPPAGWAWFRFAYGSRWTSAHVSRVTGRAEPPICQAITRIEVPRDRAYKHVHPTSRVCTYCAHLVDDAREHGHGLEAIDLRPAGIIRGPRTP